MKIFIFALLLFSFDFVHAACTAPSRTNIGTGQAGEVKMSTLTANTFNKLMFCDGTNWIDFPGSATAVVCAKNGEIYVSGGELFYCNNLFAWAFDSTGGTNGSCSQSGELKYNTGTSKVEFCNGSNWRTIDTGDSSADSVSDITETNISIEVARAQYFQITGFSGGTGTFTVNDASGTCINTSAKVCPDNTGCSAPVSTLATSGSMFVPNASYIRLAFATSTTASTACSWTGVVGGRTFVFSSTTTASDTNPLIGGTGFTDTIGAASSSLVMSNIVKFYAHTGVTVSITDIATGGSPEFRICNDATCSSVAVNWGSASQTMTNPQWLQLRTTTGAGLNYKGVNVTAGGLTIYWNVSTGTCPMTATVASGASLNCTCPAGTILSGTNAGNLVGSSNYRDSSRFCRAAVHAGAVNNATGGSVTAIGLTTGTPPGTCSTYLGTTANGTTSGASATAGGSYYFSGFGSNVCN